MVTSRLFVYRLCASTARFLFSTFVCDFCMLPDMFTMSGTCVLAWPHSWHFSAASAMETIVVVFIVVCVLCRGSACWKILRAYHDVVRRWLGYSWLKNMVVRRWLGRLAVLASCAGWLAGWLRWLAVLAGCASWRRWLAGICTAQHKSGFVSTIHFWNYGSGTASNMPSFYSNVFRTLQNIMAADPWQSLNHPADRSPFNNPSDNHKFLDNHPRLPTDGFEGYLPIFRGVRATWLNLPTRLSNHLRDLQLTCKTWIQSQTILPAHLQDFQ